jgi:hypothetical protein
MLPENQRGPRGPRSRDWKEKRISEDGGGGGKGENEMKRRTANERAS